MEVLICLGNQVKPFRIVKEDEQIFAWLIAPLGLYAKHVNEFNQEQPGADDIEKSQVFQRLQSDPEARLLIYFHGNTATVAQQRRTQEYRSYSAGSSDRIFILAF